jgi:hydroxymethylbilane synthase
MRIGTRKSTMALAQTQEIARRLAVAAPELDVEIVKFETIGDTDQTGKLLMHGGKGGAFVAEIREAVRSGRLHAAMHSLKDMPGNEDTPGLDRRDAAAGSSDRRAGAAAGPLAR